MSCGFSVSSRCGARDETAAHSVGSTSVCKETSRRRASAEEASVSASQADGFSAPRKGTKAREENLRLDHGSTYKRALP